jgi:two-component system chemotaxis response regulator CheB
VVAGSTAAIPALASVSQGLARLLVPVLVVRHMLEQRERDLARTPCGSGASARLARAGDALTPESLLAPSGHHTPIDARERVQLTSEPPVNGHRPSAEVLIRSASPLATRVVAIVLSGLGNDGACVLGGLADKGGLCFAQDPEECAAKGMPRSALGASGRVRPVRIHDFVRFAEEVAGRAG